MVGCLAVLFALTIYFGVLTVAALVAQYLAVVFFNFHASVWIYLATFWLIGFIVRLLKS